MSKIIATRSCVHCNADFPAAGRTSAKLCIPCTDTLKHCSTCKQVLPKADFGKNASQPDGLRTNCKPCNRSVNAAWRAANPGRGTVGYGGRP